MENLIRMIIKAMVDAPEEVMVKEIESQWVSIYEIKVAKTDTGKVVGKHGRNAEALRTIVNAISAKHRRRSLLQILD